MKLLLTSGGITNPTIEQALRSLLSKHTTQLRAVYIPTAANAEAGHKDWLVHDIERLFNLGWQEFDIVDVAAVASLGRSDWWPRLTTADVLIVGGGNTHYLSYWLQRSGVFDALPGWLRHDGKVYVGISAGSIVATASLRTTSGALKQFDRHEADNITALGPSGQASDKGLGLVPISFRPHLHSPYFAGITDTMLEGMARELAQPLYALDDASALKVVDETIEAVSEGIWRLFRADKQGA